jgi:hypothetical protein
MKSLHLVACPQQLELRPHGHTRLQLQLQSAFQRGIWLIPAPSTLTCEWLVPQLLSLASIRENI